MVLQGTLGACLWWHKIILERKQMVFIKICIISAVWEVELVSGRLWWCYKHSRLLRQISFFQKIENQSWNFQRSEIIKVITLFKNIFIPGWFTFLFNKRYKARRITSSTSDSTMAPPAFWRDHIAFCIRHEFDHKTDLEPQFKKAFEGYGRDYEQIRGSVSFYVKI